MVGSEPYIAAIEAEATGKDIGQAVRKTQEAQKAVGTKAVKTVVGTAVGGGMLSVAPEAAAGTLAVRLAAAAISGATGGYVGNGTGNLANGSPFNQGGQRAATLGGVMGLIFQGFGEMFEGANQTPSVPPGGKSAHTNAIEGTVAAAESTTLTRAAYVEEVEGLKDFANSARAAGQDAEATARMVSADRNALKVKYRELSPPDFVQQAEARNIQKYGNPLGPTVDQLRAQGKTWDQIIDAAARAGGKDMGL